jgi:prepilin-type N-terminal cleavage/methylation domain-containing protein
VTRRIPARPPGWRWRLPAGQRGFTLIEMLTVMALAGVLMAIAIGAMRGYLRTSRDAGTASDIRSTLRNAAEQSLSEGRTYCIYFTQTQYTVYKSSCTTGTKQSGPFSVQDTSLKISAVSFPPPAVAVPGQTTACPVTNACAYFYPRGTALPGSLQIVRTGKTYTVQVQGLTSRVTLS